MITIVSGLPRSGTSMLMQTLQAGGMPVLTDQERQPDADNPLGYLEYAPVKRLAEDASWLSQAEGKAIKVIAQLLQYLPTEHDYRVIFMERSMDAVLASQAAMLQRLGKAGASLASKQLSRVFQTQVEQAKTALGQRDRTTMLCLHYDKVLAAPQTMAGQVDCFLGMGLDRAAMATAVDPSLWNQGR